MLHDIFTQRKNTIKKRKPLIIVDIHEPSYLVEILKENKDILVEQKPLKIADILINNIAIERKTANDFIASMLTKRLFEQLNHMHAYAERILIIEGDRDQLYKTERKINPNAIRGCILSILRNYHTGVIFTQDHEDTAKYLITLAKQQEKQKTVPTLHGRTPKTLEEQKQYILEAFPHVGPAKADALIKKFETLDNIFNASEDELEPILKKQTKEFKEILES